VAGPTPGRRRAESPKPPTGQAPREIAVQTLIDWQRSNVNIDEHIPTLSTYLGHVSQRVARLWSAEEEMGDRPCEGHRDRTRGHLTADHSQH
jgi:hypothetical protein